MEVNGVNGLDLSKLNAKNSNEITKSYLKANAEKDKFVLSSKNDIKPSGKDIVKNGLLTELKWCVPFYSYYALGKEINKEKDLEKEVSHINNGLAPKEETEKPHNFGKGLLGAIIYSLPFYGSYKVGEAYLNHKELVNNANNLGIETAPSEKASGFKKYITGLGIQMGLSIPFLNTYMVGKFVSENKNIEAKINEYKANETQE